MTYKEIPFTLEQWKNAPEGSKIMNEYGDTAVYANNFPKNGNEYTFAVVWENGSMDKYTPESLLLKILIPVKTVRKWRNLDTDNFTGIWFSDKAAVDLPAGSDRFAILSAEFDEENNYVKGTVKVEEV